MENCKLYLWTTKTWHVSSSLVLWENYNFSPLVLIKFKIDPCVHYLTNRTLNLIKPKPITKFKPKTQTKPTLITPFLGPFPHQPTTHKNKLTPVFPPQSTGQTIDLPPPTCSPAHHHTSPHL